MAASAPSIRTGIRDLGWPRWVVSLTGRSPAEVPRHRRIAFGAPDAARRLNLFCEIGQLEPQVATSGNCALVFEGFLYNGDELEKDLEASGSDDAAILLEAYRRWGEEFLHRIRGIFGLVLWDADRDTLLCARDALGNHPLFFGRGGGEVVVSTALEAILHHPAISRKLNRPAIANYFLDFFPKLTETFYADIERVPPGCVLKVERGERKIYRHWEPKPPSVLAGWRGEDSGAEDAVRAFDDLFSRSVERCFEFGPLGIYLSGGLDSVSIAAIATDFSSQCGLPAPHALSLIFPTAESNEESVQKAVGAQLGLPQDLVSFESTCGTAGLLAPVIEMSEQSPQPLQNYYLGVYNHLARLGRRHGCRAILTGTGGDEWLGVSPYLAADLIRAFDFAGLYTLWRQTQRSFRPGPFRYLAVRLAWNFGFRALLRDGSIRTLGRLSPTLLNKVRRRRLRRLIQPWQIIDAELWRELGRRVENIETDRTSQAAEGAYIAETRCGLDHPLVSWEMEEVFENGKNLGVRFLHPYLDGELVEMLFKTPPALLNRGGLTKSMVREAVARRFPGLGFEQQKKIQLTKLFPLIVRSEGWAAWRKLDGAKALVAMGLAEKEKVDSWVKAAINSDDHPVAFRVWLLMTMEAWLRARV